MPKISTDKITPGMVLTKPIQGSNGMILLAEGTELNEKWIDRLAAMGIDGVWIGASEPLMPISEALAALDVRFAAVLKEPYMETLKNMVRIHIEKLYA
ncbi:MAG: hypothetical protein K0B01_12575 [Syntrophobacterales bacterium]|nr:hypothetical protein [Syntrophobacterales bacterium]